VCYTPGRPSWSERGVGHLRFSPHAYEACAKKSLWQEPSKPGVVVATEVISGCWRNRLQHPTSTIQTEPKFGVKFSATGWGFPTLCKVLPISAVLFLLVSAMRGQDHLPASTQARLATATRLEAMSLGDFTRAESEAQSGQREAQYLTSLVYGEGRLVPKNFAVARSWMLKSAEQGYVPAQGAMGEMYLIGIRDNGPIPDYADADRWLRLAATQGDADAQFWLGTGYERGWFGGTDYREALKWLRKAATQGLPNAEYCLGLMHEEGKGVPESDSLAARWYRKAADHFPEVGRIGGIWEAEVQLANLYRHDRLPKNDAEAYMWFAIVGSSVVPADDHDMKWAAQHMTRAQIAQGQHMAVDWIRRHKRQLPANVAPSTGPANPDVSAR
jgi:Sel1 repeat